MIQTAAAKTGDGQLAAVHLITGAISNLVTEGFGDVNLMQIRDSVAFLADEVDMGVGVCVKPFHAFDCADAGDLTLLLEQGQIPVNRSQGDVRVFRLKHFVDHVRRRVGIGGTQTFQYGVAFPEVLGGCCHGHLPFSLFWGSLVYTHIVAYGF